MTAPAILKQRIRSIDTLRGIVMVIMALDHVRDFLHRSDVNNFDPTDLRFTSPQLFFTRFITHYCAPIFVFLSGVSIYLMCQRKTKAEVSSFLIKRGIWLVIVEITLVSFAWSFDPGMHSIALQVIWAIGMSMIILGLLIRLPYQVVVGLGFCILLVHNIVDIPAIGNKLKGSLLADLFLLSNFRVVEYVKDHYIFIIYAVIPWTGVMLLGYGLGRYFTADVAPAFRKKVLYGLGAAAILLFVLLRWSNVYGDPAPWSVQPRGSMYTILSFINCTKYPPSLLYLCMTLGPGLLALGWLEGKDNKATAVMNVYGRVPMFYYILHFFLIHLMLAAVFFLQGFTFNDVKIGDMLFKTPTVGYGLIGVYVCWLIIVIVLYPLCKKYDRYKSTHQHWWLSYL